MARKPIFKINNIFKATLSSMVVLSLVFILFVVTTSTKDTKKLFLFNKDSSANQNQSTYKIGVYYYGIWSPEGNPNNPKNYWKPVKDYNNGMTPYSESESFAYLKPALGFYKDSNIKTVQRHIKQAHAHGISYFNFIWYWDENPKQGSENIGFNTYLQTNNRDDVEFMLSVVSHPTLGLKMSNEQMNKVANLLSNYMQMPNYLKTRTGRPIISIIDNKINNPHSHNQTQDRTGAFISLLKEKMAQKNLDFKEPYVLISSEIQGAKAYDNADAYTCVNALGLAYNESKYQGSMHVYNQRLKNYFQSYKDKPYLPCFMVDYDSRPNAGKTNGADPNKYPHIVDWDYESNYTKGLHVLKNFLDSNEMPGQNEIAGYATLYSWNDWLNGGNCLEPGETYQDRMLQRVVDVFTLYKYIPEYNTECKVQGNCYQDLYDAIGNLDEARTDKIYGWVRDPDTSVPVQIHLYKDAPYGKGGTFVTAITADKLRTDLPFIDQYHGFSFKTPKELKKGDKVYIHAIGINGNGVAKGKNPVLNGSGKIIQ